MFRSWRLKKIHARFLESCRNLKEGRAYWEQAPGTRRILEWISPIPLLGLHEDGQHLLQALHWLEENSKAFPLREDTLGHYHKLIMRNHSAELAAYRKGNIFVIGSKIHRPPAQKVPALMKQLNLKLEAEQKRLDGIARPEESVVLTFAVSVHQRIAFIHPYVDANGRVARFAMTHILRRYGLGYSIFPPVNESSDHWNALEEAHRGNLEPLVKFARACLWRV